jgi:hypothetical protein
MKKLTKAELKLRPKAELELRRAILAACSELQSKFWKLGNGWIDEEVGDIVIRLEHAAENI